MRAVSGYYFADARLQQVAFATGAAAAAAQGVSFTFYLDLSEPVNSVDPTKNVNPEVILCEFMT